MESDLVSSPSSPPSQFDVFKWLTAWRRARILAQQPIDDAVWQRVVRATRSLHALNTDDHARLRELATIFIAEKTFVGTHDLMVDDYTRAAIAAQACLPILDLGLDYYREWFTIVLYPGAFVANRSTEDEDGIVHTGYEELDGESMAGGPMALSWAEADPECAEAGANVAANVVLHECAHKLDELTGIANGLPPLHSGMRVTEWSAAFTAAFEHFSAAADGDAVLGFDDYAATDPAEFFAVMTEAFFESPATLRKAYPLVYAQLMAFYRQDPARRL
jgi:Mlc titration factor MtfA (ptsG expression regulator)